MRMPFDFKPCAHAVQFGARMRCVPFTFMCCLTRCLRLQFDALRVPFNSIRCDTRDVEFGTMRCVSRSSIRYGAIRAVQFNALFDATCSVVCCDACCSMQCLLFIAMRCSIWCQDANCSMWCHDVLVAHHLVCSNARRPFRFAVRVSSAPVFKAPAIQCDPCAVQY